MGTITRSDVGITHEEVARIEKRLESIEKRLDRLETSNNLAHGKLDLKTDAILQDTDKIRNVVEPTDEGF
jgi:hypothetical protein